MALSPVLAPGVERVVDEHAVLEHFVAILVKARQAERDREQPGGLRREIETVRICAAHDDRELPQCRIFLQAEEFQEGIEAAFLAGVGTYRNSASGSMKRRISHGQAMRSIFGRSRVTQREEELMGL